MEKTVVVTKRFRLQTRNVYQYLINQFSSRTAYTFLEKVQERIELIQHHPSIGKRSTKKANIRCIRLAPHSLIFYRLTETKIEVLCLFDTRRNPERKPY